ncbi:MAG: methionine--tRNA ligase subunit beta, partial [candidate division NC10 bacterium]|nr:methionine--tRNA ligase subunit beta [candidate division NC10 bacterium]
YADLANNLGYINQRTQGMVDRFLRGRIPPPGEPVTDPDRSMRKTVEDLCERVDVAMESLALHRALEAIWDCLDAANQYIDGQKPWELAKRDPAALRRVLGHACEALRLVTLHLCPFMPTTADRMWSRLGLPGSPADARLDKEGIWGRAEERDSRPGDALFPRVELSLEESPPPSADSSAPAVAEEISLEEFRRLDLRVAEILEARAVRGSKKLVELRVSTGTTQRTIVAGILLEYPPAELVGKRIVIVANLKPSRLMGVESRGMLLAATGPDGRIVLLTPEKPVAPGSQVK